MAADETIATFTQADLRRFIQAQIRNDPEGMLPDQVVTTRAMSAAIASAAGLLLRIDHITSGTSYLAPAEAHSLYIECVGGGAAGGGAGGAAAGQVGLGGGGGSGAYSAKWLTSNIGPHAVVVGAGGTPGAPGVANGGPGGDTSFQDSLGTTVCLAKGGNGGDASGVVAVTRAVSVGGAGGSAVSGIGDMTSGGGNGTGGIVANLGTANISGYGGQSLFGEGGPGIYAADSNGNSGAAYGGGGAGANTCGSGFGRSGGAGGSGLIRVWVFA